MLNATQLKDALKKIEDGVYEISRNFDPDEFHRQLVNAQSEAKVIKEDLESLIDVLEKLTG